MFSKTSLLLVGLGSLTGFSDAFWRMSCSIVQTGRIDPVVSPGQINGHVHKIAGASSKCFPSPSIIVRTQEKVNMLTSPPPQISASTPPTPPSNNPTVPPVRSKKTNPPTGPPNSTTTTPTAPSKKSPTKA